MRITAQTSRRRHGGQPSRMSVAARRATAGGGARAGVLALGLLLPFLAHGAQGIGGVQIGFKAAQFFDPPHETQMQSLLQAEKVQPLSEGQFLLTGLTLQSYRLPVRPGENSQPELLVKTPQCFYNRKVKIARSAGPLRVTTADGKFSIEGVGFSLFQTNSTLVISNRVLTLIDPDMLSTENRSTSQPAGEEAQPGIEIRADHFDYSGETGVGHYERNVRVTGSNDLSLRSEKLTFDLPFKQRQLKTLKAEENVIVDYRGVHATGQTGLYSAATGLIRLLGQPAWLNELREGRGDELVIDQTNRTFRSEGHAWLRMPAQGLSLSGLLAASNAVSSASTSNQFVEVTSGYYEFTTNRAVFGEHVAVTELVAAQPRGHLDCEWMEARYTGSNQLQTLVARKDVVLHDGTNILSGGQAVFNGTNGVLLMTEDPAWSSGPRSGKGDLIRINTRTNEMLVQGHASMRLPAYELARAADLRSSSPSPKPSRPETNEWAEIVSREYTLRPGSVQFRGNVQADHPRMHWTCESLDITLPEASGQPETMIANGHVAFELTDAKGQKVRGRGNDATYTYNVTPAGTNDIVQLIGAPAVLETAQATNRNNLIILDRAKQQIIAPGDYRITTSPLKGAGTNALMLPNTKLRK